MGRIALGADMVFHWLLIMSSQTVYLSGKIVQAGVLRYMPYAIIVCHGTLLLVGNLEMPISRRKAIQWLHRAQCPALNTKHQLDITTRGVPRTSRTNADSCQLLAQSSCRASRHHPRSQLRLSQAHPRTLINPACRTGSR